MCIAALYINTAVCFKSNITKTYYCWRPIFSIIPQLHDLPHFSPVLPPLMGSPPSFARFYDTRISSLNFMRNSFTYKCAQLWNKLPEDVKLADNVNIFKSKLRSIQP